MNNNLWELDLNAKCLFSCSPSMRTISGAATIQCIGALSDSFRPIVPPWTLAQHSAAHALGHFGQGQRTYLWGLTHFPRDSYVYGVGHITDLCMRCLTCTDSRRAYRMNLIHLEESPSCLSQTFNTQSFPSPRWAFKGKKMTSTIAMWGSNNNVDGDSSWNSARFQKINEALNEAPPVASGYGNYWVMKHATWWFCNAYFAVYEFNILCEISHKNLNPFTAKYGFFGLLFLFVTYDISELWRLKP